MANKNKEIIKNYEKFKFKLEGKEYLFVFFDNDKKMYDCVLVKFDTENFCHLLGIINKCSNHFEFSKKCDEGTLNEKNYQIKEYSKYNNKVNAFEALLNIGKSSKLVGDFNEYRLKLRLDKLIGNINFSLGIKCVDTNTRTYVPVSLLDGDIRSYTNNPIKILLALVRDIDEVEYKVINYGKKVNVSELVKIVSELYSLKIIY